MSAVTRRSEPSSGDPPPPSTRRLRFDVSHRPFLVLVEVTHACPLACRHCRADAVVTPDDDELRTEELVGMLGDLAALGSPRPIVVLTGGDPLARSDLPELVAAGARRGLRMAVSPAGSPAATGATLRRLRAAGATAVSFSLDGRRHVHDRRRGVPGSFAWTVAGATAARDAGLRLQVNSTIGRDNLEEVDALAELVRDLRASLWSVFFTVPVGRAGLDQALDAEETEAVLQRLAELAPRLSLKTTEAPQYRRVLAERASVRDEQDGSEREDGGPFGRGPGRAGERAPMGRSHSLGAAPGAARRRPLAVGDGRGVVFVSRHGDVYPSGFLPLRAGSIREAPLTEIYAESTLLASLRDPTRLGGRCGRCPYRDVCGGSRAQAFARSGDPLAEDPTCVYDPPVAVG